MKGVYFVQCTETERIKIGFSTNIRGRLRTYSTLPAPIRTLGVIPGADEAMERHLHQELRHHRVHGEWFEPHPAVLARAEKTQPLDEKKARKHNPEAKTERISSAVTPGEKECIRAVAEIRGSDISNLLRDNSINDLLEAARRAETKLDKAA